MTTPEAAVARLLETVGEDPARPGLVDTPARVVAAWREMTCGYRQDPVTLLRSAMFTEEHADAMVVAGPFPFSSLCEHHVLPFTGHAAIGYVPDGRIVGLSKLPRAFHALAARLQVQERLTVQAAEAVMDALAPLGAGVVVTATHACAELRGVRTRTPMTTSAMLGCLRDQPECRAELLSLTRGAAL